MMRALALDVRVHFGRLHLPYVCVFCLFLALAVWSGVLTPLWLAAGLWIVSGAGSHETVDKLGVLQSTLGVSRSAAVTARYLSLAAVASVVLLVGVVVGVFFSSTGRDVAGALGLIAIVPALTTAAAVALTLGYTASPPIRSVGLCLSAVAVAAIGFVPLITTGGTSTADLVAALYTGTVPIAAVLAVLAPTVLIVGRHYAVRAFSEATL